LNGAEDLCSPIVAKDMYDNIPGAEWHMFANSRHMCFVEDHDEYVGVIIDWMNRHDK
ncbi:MAG: alpha/beta hydrolase, partial [Clostridiales bacterium]|nr:alpha/beta hydrolase [Clostridiales bacterium]